MSTVAVDWPEEPYKGLVWYGPEDRLLFSGRDAAVKTCMHYIAASETRILLLHGQTGCGKSSFLRAALIPDLEERAHGYLFMRDGNGSPLFIRSGPDPLSRIAEEVFRYATDAVVVPGIEGETYDLTAARLDKSTVAEFIEECRRPGMMTRSLRALCEIPKTLVIILDQAEEVLTFGDSSPEHRRQFFRFVREFATSNFPVKFIIALRKDYSGEFLGLAQLGGAIDLRINPVDMSPPSTEGTVVDRVVKSDIKIFLLPELRKDAVQCAIELPTSKEKVYEDKDPPFTKYQFTYAPGVPKRIVDDLFAATSATAVLPVMQIVCRDLYHAAKSGAPPWQIDEKLYKAGAGVTGPVSRHITDSLKKSFGKLPPGVDEVAEAQRWREVLYRLVRRESDGTVHTNIVDEAQLKAIAQEIGVKAQLADVTAYLTRSDVLLLRSVTALTGTEDRESKLYSLGHDAIGMVLYEWKMRALANERVTAEEKASKKRIRHATFASIGAVLVVAGVAIAMVMAVAKGRADQKHDVLLRIASANGRSVPMGAAFAAAHATYVADDMHRLEIWKQRDRRADELLANILAGLPKMTTFGATAAQESDKGNTGIPLAKSIGFAIVAGTRVEMVTAVNGKDENRTQFEVDKPGDNTTTVWTGGEPEPGTMVLLQSVLPSDTLETTKTVERVYIIRKDQHGQSIRPLDANYFRKKTTSSALRLLPPVLQKAKGRRGDVPLDEFVSLELGGSVVVLSKVKLGKELTKGDMYVASFVYDPKAPANDPFRIGMEAEFHLDLEEVDTIGFNEPLLLDGYMIVPVRLDPTQSGASSDIWAVRYDLRTGSRRPAKGLDALMNCKNTKCGWELIRRDPSDNLIVFGKAKASGVRPPGSRSLAQAAEPDIEQYERFVVFDAETDEGVAIDAQQLREARKKCEGQFRGELRAPGKGPTSRMFVAGEKNRLLFGLQTDLSVDLVEVRSGSAGAIATCVGVLLDAGERSTWRSARGGNTLLASSGNTGLSWNVDEKSEDRVKALVSQGGLVGVACEHGLRGHESPDDKLTATTTTYLGAQARKLCDGSASQTADKSERPVAQFPGVEVTTKGALGSAFEKQDKK